MRKTIAMLEREIEGLQHFYRLLYEKWETLDQRYNDLRAVHTVQVRGEQAMVIALEKTVDAVAHVLTDLRAWRREGPR